MDELETLKAYNNIYLEIIMRYREHIEEKEGIYITDLPKLVTPSNESVIFLAREVQNNFPVYSFNDNFPDAARLAYQHVKDKIMDISLPLQFWLSPADTIKYGAGDVFDKATLLCSVLIALGNVSSRIAVVVRGEERHFVVYSEFKDSIIAINIEKGVTDYKNFDALMKALNLGNSDDTTAYEFNDKMYRDIV